jgi:MoaD family protein
VAKVQVKVLGHLADIPETQNIEIELGDGMVIKDVLNKLIQQYGDKFKEAIFDPKTGLLRPYISILVNGRHINYKLGLETKLGDNDVMVVLPPIDGG